MTRFASRLSAATALAMALAFGAVAPTSALNVNAGPVVLSGGSVLQAGLFSRTERRTPQQELQRILRTHYYYGGSVGRSVREAAGPGTTLLRDNRIWGEPARCSFVTYRGGRAIVCDSL